MIKENKKRNENIIYGSLIILFFGYIGWYLYYTDKNWNKMMNEQVVNYTICKVTDYRIGYKVSPSFTFFFFIDSKRIEDEETLEKGQQQDNLNVYINKYYFLRFNAKDPKYNEIVWDKPVHDSLVQCCRKQVWDEPPF